MKTKTRTVTFGLKVTILVDSLTPGNSPYSSLITSRPDTPPHPQTRHIHSPGNNPFGNTVT
ncbi:hypothetical protein E2C01_053157 [Portunus trituberculatus]|uniref:Uncharacterized protein n=1 Tax=Portunus trituberculatus TaxID=210409 RepID=A0A5B7GJJ5_PORTR|nr:hypothetical protein [Portunus trituberculatus]